MTRRTVLLLVAVIATAPIYESVALTHEDSDPEGNFDHLWSEFDKRYGVFIPKRIDWDLLREVYRSKVTPKTTDNELFNIMSDMLEHLNDFHVTLDSPELGRTFRSRVSKDDVVRRFGSYEAFLQLFESRPVAESYLREGLSEVPGGVFAYGWVGDRIGYFHFNRFEDVEASSAAVDLILEQLGDADALIVDIRRNRGGDDSVGQAIAGRFADKKRLYMMTQTRNGPAHTDFDESRQWHVEPSGAAQFTKPVILVIDETTISAAENFALAMRVLPHATLIGDHTAGCYGDTETLTLPNGWEFSVTVKLFVDQDGFCWEGIGIPPDIRVLERDEYGEVGRDRQLEFAVELANSGALRPFERTWEYPIGQQR